MAKVEVLKPGKKYKRQIVKSGLSFGSALAMILSYVEHKSILYAIIHGILSWIYVVYYAIVYRLL